MKILLFGGSFSPVHSEHVRIAKEAQKALQAEKLIVIPAAVSPFKTKADLPVENCSQVLPSDADRLAMLRLAFADFSHTEISDYEICCGGTSYSYTTCAHFRSLYPKDELYFLIGSDSFYSFPQWKYPERIVNDVRLAVIRRSEENLDERSLQAFAERFHTLPTCIDFSTTGISSTQVRTLLSLGADASGLLPKAVQDYILQRGLYRIDLLVQALALEKENRRAHSVRVAVTATEHAKRFRISPQKALVAAGLHDCAKNLALDDKKLFGFIPPEGVPESVMHQYSGAYLAEKFGIRDTDILNAVRYHTSGRPDMSDLEKLIYLADMTEAGRHYPGVDEIRAAFDRDLNEAMRIALQRTLAFLRETGSSIYPLSLQAYEYYKND